MLNEASAAETSAEPARWLVADNRRAVLLAFFVGLAGVALGYAGTSSLPSTGLDDELLLLLRFMALTKATMVVGAAWLVDWRLRYAADAGVTTGYMAIALMAIAPGSIWFSVYIVPAAILFHAGMLLALIFGLRDGRLRQRDK